ncbi:unnamed protein product, partial [Cylicostephanus goldi]
NNHFNNLSNPVEEAPHLSGVHFTADQKHTAIIAALTGDKKTSSEENAVFNPRFVTGTNPAGQMSSVDILQSNDISNDVRVVEVEDVKPPVNGGFGSNGIKKERIQLQKSSSNVKAEDYYICTLIKQLSAEKLAEVNSEESCHPVLGKRSKVMIRRVRVFFEELKKVLGDACEGTVLSRTVELTAWACGVTTDTVTRIGSRDEFVFELLPRPEPKAAFTKEQRKQNTLMKYGGRWGETVKDLIENKLPKDGMSLSVNIASFH